MIKMSDVARISELVEILNNACDAYYDLDNPIMSDKEYDALYDELENLEMITGVVMTKSPTQRVQGHVLDCLKKVEHSKPMLSAQKTKDIDVIQKYLGNKDWYCSYKLDGLTIVLRMDNGKLQQAITRGNGIIGEDVTEQAKMITNIPLEIPYKEPLEIRGECVIDWDTFKKINFDNKFSHPRNYAAGSIRQLDTNITRDRKLKFIAFEVVTPLSDDKLNDLNLMLEYGFDIVQFCGAPDAKTAAHCMPAERSEYPVDGLIYEIRSRKISNSMENTSHHEGCRYALKWKDEEYDTKLIDVEFTIGKTGVLTPTAVFEPIDIDGTIVERASVHNISILKQILHDPYVGQEVIVYKANMIIPQISAANFGGVDDDYIDIPTKCPYCGEPTKIVKEKDTEVLVCPNENCVGRLVKLLAHAASRDALNIDGLSEQTIQFLVDRGWVKSFKDIYHLKEHAKEWSAYSGFGEQSVRKILKAIESSRNTNLERFLYSLSIPQVGKTASKAINKLCKGNFNTFIDHLPAVRNKLVNMPGYGNAIALAMKNYFNVNEQMVREFAQEFTFDIIEIKSTADSKIKDKVFVVTGTVEKFKNRKELEQYITDRGGKLSCTVSKNTFVLLNNDAKSNSSKNKKAKELGIPIWSEDEFLEFCK